MSERTVPADDMKFGLLMESAQTHQRLAEAHLEKLRAHTQELDGVVREEIRHTLVEELQALTSETQQAAEALRRMGRSAGLRSLAWTLTVALLCSSVPALIVHGFLPSARELGRLRAQRDALATNIARLEREGGHARWRRCGEDERLCVRVDREAPVYGEHRDYYVLQGY